MSCITVLIESGISIGTVK